MDDELEDKIFYETFKSHMKVLSKFVVGITPLNSSLSYTWKLFRLYILKPEVLICGLLIFIFLLYIQAADVWTRGIIGRISASFGLSKSRNAKLNLLSLETEKHSWETKKETTAVYAVQGRRPRMEDRFVVDENINNSTGISLFAIFDGHGGEFAADYCKDILIQNLYNKLIESSKILSSEGFASSVNGNNNNNSNKKSINEKDDDKNEDEANKDEIDEACKDKQTNNKLGNKTTTTTVTQRRQSFRKSLSQQVDDSKSPSISNQLLENDLLRKYGGRGSSAATLTQMAKDQFLKPSSNANESNTKPKTYDAKCYIQNGSINFGKMITDEVLAADYNLVETAKKQSNLAGTTALIAIIHHTKLIVANVGDSRGVMCDNKGKAIPLSFDHKPQQVREHKRIADAGGFIAFKGVWRVAGILATSRALGDYPLKDKKLVIAEPDILTFDLIDHRPMFVILATDGLWDTFSNEEAVAYIKDHLNEPHFGAKSLALQSYNRGSVDNITVLVIVFKNGRYEVGSSAATNE
uniref:Putative cell adhesion n=1 Tax=Corethrella appendiculata TaxID=1370023 RepID=U5EEM8_9DIPT